MSDNMLPQEFQYEFRKFSNYVHNCVCVYYLCPSRSTGYNTAVALGGETRYGVVRLSISIIRGKIETSNLMTSEK